MKEHLKKFVWSNFPKGSRTFMDPPRKITNINEICITLDTGKRDDMQQIVHKTNKNFAGGNNILFIIYEKCM